MTKFEQIQQELSAKAAQIDRNYRAERQAVITDRNLSEEGKKARLQVMDVTRTSQVAALQEDAQRQLIAARSAHKIALRKAKQAAAEKERAVLGDETYLRLLERRVSAASAMDAVTMLEEAGGEWERTVLTALLEEKIGGALASGQISTDLVQGNARFQEIRAKDNELADLERQALDLGQTADDWVRTMDGERYRQDFAARMGLSPEFVPVPGYGG